MSAQHRRTCDDFHQGVRAVDARVDAVARRIAAECVRLAMQEARRREALIEEALISGAHLRDLAGCYRVDEPASWRLV